ncbi:MAG: hypothetical protein ACXWLT_01095 [Rhizomicrobium sp.]
MSDIDEPHLHSAILAIADELSDLALEVAMLGESLSDSGVSRPGSSQAMQKFDAFSQALNSYSHLLYQLIRHSGHTQGDWSALLDCIPFFHVRERIRAKICSSPLFLEQVEEPDDIWLEC